MIATRSRTAVAVAPKQSQSLAKNVSFFFSCAVACRDFAASTLLIRSSLPVPFLSDDEVEFVRDSGSTGHSLFQLLFFEAFHRWHAGEFLRGAEE